MATRISLMRSIRHKEQREQIGDLLSSFGQGLIHLESKCLIRLSEAARHANQPQIALNSMSQALRLSSVSSTDVSEEFSNVLWLMKEPKLAVQSLAKVASSFGRALSADQIQERTKNAMLLARVVRTDLI